MNPFGWPTRPLGDLFDVTQGKAVGPEARKAQPQYPFLRTANVLWGRVDVSTLDAMHFSAEELSAKTLLPGDMLVCEGGDIGRSAIWDGTISPCGFQNHLHRLRPKSPEVHPPFFMYALRAGFTQLGAFEGAGNRTTIPNLSRGRLQALHVPYPAASVQSFIADLLKLVEQSRDTAELQVAAAQALKEATMQRLFTRGLLGEEPASSGYPEIWRAARFDELAILHRGYDLPVASRSPGSIPVIGSNGVVGHHAEAKRQGPGVIIGRSGTIGKSFYVDGPYWPLNTSLFVNDFIGNDPLYVHYFMQHIDLTSLTAGVSVPTLNRNLVHETPIRIPARDEQIEIAQVLAAIDKKIYVSEQRMIRRTELFETLLHDLMSGALTMPSTDRILTLGTS